MLCARKLGLADLQERRTLSDLQWDKWSRLAQLHNGGSEDQRPMLQATAAVVTLLPRPIHPTMGAELAGRGTLETGSEKRWHKQWDLNHSGGRAVTVRQHYGTRPSSSQEGDRPAGSRGIAMAGLLSPPFGRPRGGHRIDRCDSGLHRLRSSPGMGSPAEGGRSVYRAHGTNRLYAGGA